MRDGVTSQSHTGPASIRNLALPRTRLDQSRTRRLPTVACQDWSTIVHSAGLDLTDCGRLEQTSPERPEETRVFAIYSILMNNHHNAAGFSSSNWRRVLRSGMLTDIAVSGAWHSDAKPTSSSDALGASFDDRTCTSGRLADRMRASLPGTTNYFDRAVRPRRIDGRRWARCRPGNADRTRSARHS